MTTKLPMPSLKEARASIERLRREAHWLKDRLQEAYDKISLLEKASEKPGRPRRPPRDRDNARH
jgi:hypothetical protein